MMSSFLLRPPSPLFISRWLSTVMITTSQYSPRFKGLTMKKGDGLGLNMPKQSSIADILDILEHTTKFNDNMFMVRNFTDPSLTCTVDINIGICECKTGRDGSVGKHQYILCAHKQVKRG